MYTKFRHHYTVFTFTFFKCQRFAKTIALVNPWFTARFPWFTVWFTVWFPFKENQSLLHLGMSKVSTRWVPEMLTSLQKRQRVELNLQSKSETTMMKFMVGLSLKKKLV